MSHVLHKYKLNCLSSWAPALRPAEFWASPGVRQGTGAWEASESVLLLPRRGDAGAGLEAAGSALALPAQEHSSVKYSAF